MQPLPSTYTDTACSLPQSAPCTSSPRAASLPQARPDLGATWSRTWLSGVGAEGQGFCKLQRHWPGNLQLWLNTGCPLEGGVGWSQGICILALLGPPTPLPQSDSGLYPSPPFRSMGERPNWERGSGGSSLQPHACFSHAQVLTCKDSYVGLGSIKGASSLPTQLLTLLLQRSYLETEGTGSWNLGVLESGSIAYFLMSPCFLPPPLLDWTPEPRALPFLHPHWSVCNKLST